MSESGISFLLVSCYCRYCYWCSYYEASVNVFGRHGRDRIRTLHGLILLLL